MLLVFAGVLLVFLLTQMASPSLVAAATPRAKILPAEVQMVRRINTYRVGLGLPRLVLDARLQGAAIWMSTDMAMKNRFSHTDSRGRDPFVRIASFGYPSAGTYRGENLAAGNKDVEPTFGQWRASPGHDRNMRNAQFRVIGVARICREQSTYTCYWTTTFGSKLSAPLDVPKTAAFRRVR